MRMQLLLCFQCTVCLRMMCNGEDNSAVIRAALFGHRKYALCPGCLKEVQPEDWTLDYRRRWGARVRQIRREVP